MSIEMVREKFLSEIEVQKSRPPIARRYSAEFREEVVSLHRKGISFGELEKYFFCGRKLIARWMQDHKAKTATKFITFQPQANASPEPKNPREILLKTLSGVDVRILY